jgi:hypothetical protein
MKLTIQRSKWYRGNEGTHSRLLISEAAPPTQRLKMCCLGFLAKALGASDDDIVNQTEPENCPSVFKAGAPWLLYEEGERILINSEDAHTLIKLNDIPLHNRERCLLNSEEEREREISAIFAKHDVQVKFVD